MPSEEKPLQNHPALLMQVSAQPLHSELMCLKPCRQLDLITVLISDHLPGASPGARCLGGSICCWLEHPPFFGASALKKEPTLDSAHSTQKGPRTQW